MKATTENTNYCIQIYSFFFRYDLQFPDSTINSTEDHTKLFERVKVQLKRIRKQAKVAGLYEIHQIESQLAEIAKTDATAGKNRRLEKRSGRNPKLSVNFL